jgi:hypothetical protein
VARSQLVPDGFDVPSELVTEEFRLEPLGPQHNERDHAAWMGSIEHIRSTPGFDGWAGRPWRGCPSTATSPIYAGTADDFATRVGFTYSVIQCRATR